MATPARNVPPTNVKPTVKPPAPAVVMPAVPANVKPAVPATVKPAVPATVKPPAPATVKPAVKSVVQAVVPQTAKPAAPATTKPIVKVTAATAKPSAAQQIVSQLSTKATSKPVVATVTTKAVNAVAQQSQGPAPNPSTNCTLIAQINGKPVDRAIGDYVQTQLRDRLAKLDDLSKLDKLDKLDRPEFMVPASSAPLWIMIALTLLLVLGIVIPAIMYLLLTRRSQAIASDHPAMLEAGTGEGAGPAPQTKAAADNTKLGIMANALLLNQDSNYDADATARDKGRDTTPGIRPIGGAGIGARAGAGNRDTGPTTPPLSNLFAAGSPDDHVSTPEAHKSPRASVAAAAAARQTQQLTATMRQTLSNQKTKRSKRRDEHKKNG